MKEKPVGRFNLSFNVRPVVGKKIVASNAVGTRIGIGGGMQAWQPVNLQSVFIRRSIIAPSKVYQRTINANFKNVLGCQGSSPGDTYKCMCRHQYFCV